MRIKTANTLSKETRITWRSHEPSRIETFSDAIFAFAVTLIILSLEVPKTFTELFETMKGTLSFAVCFIFLFNFWQAQNIFFRRYGLSDRLTYALNGILLFMVLVYVYPLKFLTRMLFSNSMVLINGKEQEMIHPSQMPVFMLIYGAGYTLINLLFFLMYLNAKSRSEELKLTEAELFETNTVMIIHFICACIGLGAMILAIILPPEISGGSGYFYFSIGIAYFLWYSYRGKKFRKKFQTHRVKPVSH